MGTVYLVGAGPGDPGLLTRRAAALLRRADVVVHDALIDRRLLRLARRGARRIDVGKRCGGRRTEQERIHALLIEEAARAKIVVRLKGGDPFVFGRGGEEARALAAAGVRFRVVPGVTAGLAAPAYAGIPATQRGVASMVTLVTGHAADGATPVRWRELARLGGTIVVYMGARSIGRIARELMAGGLSGETPAAAIEWGTYARQRTIEAPLAQIAQAALRAGIEAPSVFVIGDVVALRGELSWFTPAACRCGGCEVCSASASAPPSVSGRSGTGSETRGSGAWARMAGSASAGSSPLAVSRRGVGD